MSYIMVPASNIAHAISEGRATAVKIVWDGDEHILTSVVVSDRDNALSFYSHDDERFDVLDEHEIAVEGWL